jgi:hypothetical protein
MMLNIQVSNQLLPLTGLPKDLKVEEQECCEWTFTEIDVEASA